ncbi:MAG: DNA polymerase domain-containing protein [Bacteroidota bacterium]|nr:DNA polymerase domain-containing protein [Bacteroidota bacterium]
MNKSINTTAWLFDVYPSNKGITIWLIDEEGVKHTCYADFVPSFYLYLNQSDMKRAEVLATRLRIPVFTHRTKKRELYSNEEWNVLQVNVHDTMKFREAVRFFEKYFPPFAFYDSNILPAQLYFYHTGLFPLAFGEYRINEKGKVVEFNLADSREAFEYTLPPLSIMNIRNANNFLPPKYRSIMQLEISYENNSYLLEQQNPAELLDAFNWHIHRFDPDVILTEYGDASLMPMLNSISKKCKIPLHFNRDKSVNYFTTKESSYFQYGKIVHKDGAFELAGRWHIDVHNSFTVAESFLDGLYDIARITQMPVQRQARASIGTGLSSIQLSWAYRNNFLIPSKKREPEDFKSAATLLLADRGGLIFQPLIGYHEDVAELDFVSMYPTIMVRHNVSPETINCQCCYGNYEVDQDVMLSGVERSETKSTYGLVEKHVSEQTQYKTVPELDYRICRRREGIVPATLRAVVEKRAYYKQKKQQLKHEGNPLWQVYDNRQSALKWMLVTCFGYLGYKNARFGKIEAHESVNAFSRDAILQAKEIAENRGFKLLHAIIDCMWLKKLGATENDYLDLCKEIEAKVGIDISLEGIYNWILYPASKMDALLPTANRYVGYYRSGEVKIRGIETRRKDTPKFIKLMQGAMLEKLSAAESVAEVAALVPEVLEVAREYIERLQAGTVNPMELVIRRNVSQEASEYSNNSVNAVVTRLIEESGVHIAAGERIEYILIDQSGKRQPEKAKPLSLYAFEDGYDIEKYTKLAIKAAETLLLPFGYDMEKLNKIFKIGKKRKQNTSRKKLEELVFTPSLVACRK